MRYKKMGNYMNMTYQKNVCGGGKKEYRDGCAEIPELKRNDYRYRSGG